MSTDQDKHGEFAKPLPGESLDAYLRRTKTHPDQPDATEATDEQEKDLDKTDQHEGGAVIIGKR
jgi:hypothetical protein